MRKKTKYLTTAQKRIVQKRTTLAEEILWNSLRKNDFGFSFNRQRSFTVIDSGKERIFTVDFYCSECKLVIEADGAVHKQKEKADQIRTALLEQQHGVKVIRFSNPEISGNIVEVLRNIKQYCMIKTESRIEKTELRIKKNKDFR